MSPDGLSRGVPAQDLPENQDPSVRFTVDEVTGFVTPMEDPEPAPEKAPKKKAAKKPAPPAQRADGGGDELAGDAENGGAGSEKAASITSVREVGS